MENSNKIVQGSELHRLKPMEKYDKDLFERLYKKVTPYIKKLSRQIDCRRFNLSNDIIQSLFTDKFIYVFNRYQDEEGYDEERLKATILSSLSIYKNKLLRNAYTDQAEYYQSLSSLDELYDDDKESVEYDDTEIAKESQFQRLWEYMRSNLSDDAFILFEVIYLPPPFIKCRTNSDHTRIHNILLVEFFNLPLNRKSTLFISDLKKEIEYYKERAGTEL